MVVQFFDTNAGTTVYVNPHYVISVRPDPAAPDDASLVKMQDGEVLHVRGDHTAVAGKLMPPRAA